MKAKFYLLLLIVSSFSLMNARGERMMHGRKMMRGKRMMMMQEDASCQCYCSVLCGPRDPNPNDAPFRSERYPGICFCAQRDEDLYELNKCDVKKSEFKKPPCCGDQ